MRGRFLSDTSALYSGARFLLTGFTFAVLYFAIYIALMRLAGITPWLAAMVAFASLIPPHFYAHARFSFRHGRRDILTFARYAAALAGIAVVNGALVWFYYDVLLADPLAAQVLALPIVLGLNFLLFRWGVFNEHAGLGGLRITPRRVVAALAALAGLAALYVIVATVILYTNAVFRLDEIHLNHDYLFSPVSESIFGRQNGHLVLFPGLVFAANLFLLDGKGMWLAFVIVGANAAAGLILCAVFAHAALRLRVDRVSIVLGAVVIGLAAFWLSGGRTLYWGVGVHNYLAGLGAVAACLGLALATHNRVRIAGALLFLAGAILASGSFNAGAAVWGLPIAAAILSRRSPKVVAAAVTVSLVGGFLAVGLFAVNAGKTAEPGGLLSLPMFAATFLGAPVIERGSRRIRLSSLGEALVERVRDILRAVDELDDLARALQPRQVEPVHHPSGQALAQQDGVAVPAQADVVAAHVERFIIGFGGYHLARERGGAGRKAPVGLLQHHDVGISLRDHVERAVGPPPHVEAQAFADVVTHHAQRLLRRRGAGVHHGFQIVCLGRFF